MLGGCCGELRNKEGIIMEEYASIKRTFGIGILRLSLIGWQQENAPGGKKKAPSEDTHMRNTDM